METLFKFLSDISKLGWAFVGGGISLCCYFILEKFKNRQSSFIYSINYSSVGTTLVDNVFGEIVVNHNGREIKHLNFVTLQIENDSNTDFENVKLTCWVDGRSQFLGWSGHYDDTRIHIKLNEDFLNRTDIFFEKYSQLSQEEKDSGIMGAELRHYFSNKEFMLPVFNRGSSITMQFLVENFEGKVPLLQCPISHRSVRMIEAEDQDLINKRLGKNMFIYGYIILAFAIAILFISGSYTTRRLIVFSIISVMYVWLGLLIHYFITYIKSIFK